MILPSGYRIARVCFLFSQMSSDTAESGGLDGSNSATANKHARRDLYAFVLWFDPISSPSPHSKLRTVQKMRVGNQQATGIVPLVDIKFSCGLTPVLGESFWDGTENQGVNESSSLDSFDAFYINSFNGHLDYELFS